MFAYGCMYIYKQGFTIRGKKIPGRTVAGRAHFLQERPPGPHRVQPQAGLLPVSLLCSKKDQCRNSLSDNGQNITVPLFYVSGGLCASKSFLHSLIILPERKHRIRHLKTWLYFQVYPWIKETLLDKSLRSLCTPFSWFI